MKYRIKERPLDGYTSLFYCQQSPDGNDDWGGAAHNPCHPSLECARKWFDEHLRAERDRIKAIDRSVYHPYP